MKVLYVVDSVVDISKKIDTIKNHFGGDILYIVKANLVKIFETYGHKANAVYHNNLPTVIQTLLLKHETLTDVVYLKSSVELDKKLLNKFVAAIGDRTKVVNVVPKYNIFEKMVNGVYNIYLKSLFKTKDSLASPKIQFLPQKFVEELAYSHFGNRIFELNMNMCVNVYIEDNKINENIKTPYTPNRNLLLPLIFALVITLAMVLSLAFLKRFTFIFVLIYIFLYLLDLIMTIIYMCKSYFDKRIFK